MQISRHPELHRATRTARWTRRKAAGTELPTAKRLPRLCPLLGALCPFWPSDLIAVENGKIVQYRTPQLFHHQSNHRLDVRREKCAAKARKSAMAS
jgi:hypothetical protein